MSAPMSELPPESGHLADISRLSGRCNLGDCRHSRNGIYGYRRRAEHSSALMLAARITLAHFSVSSAMSFAKSAGEPASAVPPRLARRALILGSARPALIPLLSLSVISAGVAFGAPMPYQVLASFPATNSPTLVTSGTT